MTKTIFIDKNDRHWDEESLNELIETLEFFKKFLDRVSYY